MKTQSKKKNHRLRWVLIAVGIVVLLMATAIGIVSNRVVQDFSNSKAGEVADELPPCGTSATQVGLGSPYRDGQPVAYFTTDGSDVYISARKFSHGGFLDPKIGTTLIWIGDEAALPAYDEQRGVVSNTRLRLSVEEGKHKKAQLPAGRYWLWTSTGGDIAVASCGQISG